MCWDVSQKEIKDWTDFKQQLLDQFGSVKECSRLVVTDRRSILKHASLEHSDDSMSSVLQPNSFTNLTSSEASTVRLYGFMTLMEDAG